MDKIKNAIKSAYQWLSLEGGMLHFLGFMCMILTLEPFVGWGLASVIAWIIAFGKEAIDYFIRKSNDLKQVLNDIIRDAIGWGISSLIVFLTKLTN
jgi:hypothetical protein